MGAERIVCCCWWKVCGCLGSMLSWVGRVRCALHWEEKEVGREPKGFAGGLEGKFGVHGG